MKDRDEKGKFAKGNNIGKKTRISGGQAAEKGRKGGKVTKQNRIQKWIEAMGASELTEKELRSIDLCLPTLTDEELAEITANKDIPSLIKRKAEGLLDSENALNNFEKVANRAFGSPKQKIEQEVIENPIVKFEIVDTRVKESEDN